MPSSRIIAKPGTSVPDSALPRPVGSLPMPRTAPAHSGRGALQAILFDMDGLLIDSEPLWYEVESEVMAHLGGQWSPADQQELVGGSLPKTVDYLLARAARRSNRGPAAERAGHFLGTADHGGGDPENRDDLRRHRLRRGRPAQQAGPRALPAGGGTARRRAGQMHRPRG